MIPYSHLFDQPTLARMIEHNAVVQRYRDFFSLIDWQPVLKREVEHSLRGRPAHPESAYIKALFVKLIEDKEYITQLRAFLAEHPLLMIELGFRLHLDPTHPYGFDIERTLPKKRWFREKQRTIDHHLLQDLFQSTVHALQEEIPGLGEIIAVDVKHIYAWVRENNPRESIKDRFSKDHQPKGDPDCRVGVKRSTNLEQPDGSTKVKKEYLWGYGSGVVSALTADYGDVVLAEHTMPFNEGDVSYYLPLYRQTVATVNRFPTHITADAAFDAWYVYQTCAHHGGIAAVPINQHAHPTFTRDADGIPLCPKKFPMVPTFVFHHTNGYRAQRYRCPLLHPKRTGETCDHEQFTKGKGCVKDINIERGGIMRVTLDRDSPLYKTIYTQRTSVERINSQAKAQGIERPKVRNRRSVENINTLIYIIINIRDLQRARIINQSLLPIK
jgi:Transposase DDE domain